jgi:hypothetical protein
MRKAAVFAAMALVVGFLLTCADLTPPGKRYALVYGVTTYTTNPLFAGSPNLTYPDMDATSVSEMLVNSGYESVRRRIRNPSIDEAPTKADLETDIANLAALIGPNDTFIFYFSGHGGALGDDYYFAPYLGIDGTTYQTNWGLCVNQDELAAYLAAIPTARKIVILDTCFSGGFVENPLEVDIAPPAYIRQPYSITPDIIAQAIQNYEDFSSDTVAGISPYGNAIVIAASGSAEASYEEPSIGHGVATYFLLQAPQSGDLNGDGVVSAMEAFALIKAGLDTEWNPYVNQPGANVDSPDSHYSYLPHISGGPLDYVIF